MKTVYPAILLTSLLAAACVTEDDLELDDLGQAEEAVTNFSRTLCIQASGNSDSGTSGDITLTRMNSFQIHECTITGGIDPGQSRCCTDSDPDFYIAPGGDPWNNMYVEMTSSNGLQFTGLYDGEKWTNSWGDFSSNIYSEGCTGGVFDCNNSWLDSDGHRDCTTANLRVDLDTIECGIVGIP